MDDTGQQNASGDRKPPVPAGVPSAECVELWFDLVDATDEILLANLRSSGRTPEEVLDAYRECYARWVEEHDRKVRNMMIGFGRSEARHGG